MRESLDASDLLYAEALSFRLTDIMPRPEAQAATKELCQQARADSSLEELARAAYPDLEMDGIFAADRQMGEAPSLARTFATAVRAQS
jgi:3-carboxy-cis,cis-muconate cycloisomerase